MKRIVCVVSLLFAVTTALAGINGGELASIALQDALRDAQASLAGASLGRCTVAILPLENDGDGTVAGLLKNVTTGAGLTCVEGKEDPMWNEILKQVEWDVRKADVLDPATVSAFGKLKSARMLLYGSLRTYSAAPRYVLVEVELHLTSVDTKQHVWGGVFAKRIYGPSAGPRGDLDVPVDVRNAIRDELKAKIARSLAASDRVAGVKNAAMLPIAGDRDQYVAGLFRDALSESKVTPLDLDVATRAEVRFALRQGVAKADGIAYGVLRDFSPTLRETGVGGKRRYSADAEVQFWIEKGATREILWSDTIGVSREFEIGPRGWWDSLKYHFPILESKPWLVIVAPLVLLIGLFLLLKIFGALTRVR